VSIVHSVSLVDRLRAAADTAALRVLSDQDRDPYSPTRGCFDRRYWAWKLVDFPEATFQRHVYPLAMLVQDPASRLNGRSDVYDAIAAGLRYAVSIQHRNGSFDQAFPFDQSWGATAFLLHPLLVAFDLVAPMLGADADRIRERLAVSARFLCDRTEAHGRITNHLAGGAHSLTTAGRTLGDARFTAAASSLMTDILATQHNEGWFPEYGGADPGYQTLTLFYLAEVARISSTPSLSAALTRSLEFLQWFVHPDGTFGGVYGSRRTRIAYLGGFALLAGDSPIAAAVFHALAPAAATSSTVSVDTVDSGNLAPLFTSLVRAIACVPRNGATSPLPCDRPEARADFPGAGLYVRSDAAHYSVIGSANGGTLAVFNRGSRTIARDDGGYVAELEDGRRITSQVTARRAAVVDGDSLVVTAAFCEMRRSVPTPALFLALRLLNLTLMRSVALGNWIKRLMVSRLITPQTPVSLSVERRFTFGRVIAIADRFENPRGLRIRWLRGGVPFNSVHMASAGYIDGAALSAPPLASVDIDAAALTANRSVDRLEHLG
jgi:hypothetical protein